MMMQRISTCTDTSTESTAQENLWQIPEIATRNTILLTEVSQMTTVFHSYTGQFKITHPVIENKIK